MIHFSSLAGRLRDFPSGVRDLSFCCSLLVLQIQCTPVDFARFPVVRIRAEPRGRAGARGSLYFYGFRAVLVIKGQIPLRCMQFCGSHVFLILVTVQFE